MISFRLFYRLPYSRNVWNMHVQIHFNLSLPTVSECCFAGNLKSRIAESVIKSLVTKHMQMEHCKNPWSEECRNHDIEVYILLKGERLPICRRCWSKIADKDVEW